MPAVLALQEFVIRTTVPQSFNTIDGCNSKTKKKLLSFVIGHIQADLNGKIQIDHLSDKDCMSRAAFYRAFKRELGINPHGFILNERIKKVKKLLSQSSYNITGILLAAWLF